MQPATSPSPAIRPDASDRLSKHFTGQFTAAGHNHASRSDLSSVFKRVQPVSNVDRTPGHAPPAGGEKRFAKRRSMVASGTLSGPKLEMTLTCAVRDTSSTGALIELTTAGSTPTLP